MKLIRNLAWLVGPLLTCPSAAQSVVTQADLLRRLTDLDRLTRPPPPGQRTLMFSSFDRRSRLDAAGSYVDWEANDDCGQFIRRGDDGWHVMAEVRGPGAITRIWSSNPQGQIRFILDGQLVIDTEFDRLLSGQLPPFEPPLAYGGTNCYFPLGFARNCQVISKDSRSCYQINVVQFPPGTRVQRFDFELDEPARQALAEVRRAFEEGLSGKQLFGTRRLVPVAAQQDLAPGQVLREIVEGAGTVRAFYAAVTDRNPTRELYAMHRCILRIYFDGEDEPCVEAPLSAFFGSGFDLVPFNSLVAGTDKSPPIPLPDRRIGQDRFMYCYFPMPYRNGLAIELENCNQSKRKIGLLLHLLIDKTPPARDALRFRGRFRSENPCRAPDYPILEARGPGRLVGCVLSIDCPRATWWGEGDEKIWIDGESFPSFFGTGSDGYLGDTPGLHLQTHPLHGVTRCGPYGKNSGYRWQIPDSVEFSESIRFVIENLQKNGIKDTYYASLVYWYGGPARENLFKPLTGKDLTPPGLRIPGAIEIEGQVLGADWGNIVKERPADGIEFSGGQAVNLTTDQPVTVNIPSPTARTVNLKLRASPHRSFETVVVSNSAGSVVGVVAYDGAADGIYTVGVVSLVEGDNHLRVQASKTVTLDCWILEPLE